MSEKEPSKSGKSLVFAKVLYLLLVVVAGIFLYFFWNSSLVPQRYKTAVTILLLIVLVLLGIGSIRKVKSSQKNKTLVCVVNVLLSLLLAGGSIFLPYTQSKISHAFQNTTIKDKGKNLVNVNVYVMSEDYKSAHPDLFAHPETSLNLTDYINRVFITQTVLNQENLQEAIAQIKTELNAASLFEYEIGDVLSAVDALYHHDGDALILDESWAESIRDIDGYETFFDDTEVIYSARVEDYSHISPLANRGGESHNVFQILCIGSDTRSQALSEYGRTDVVIMATVNLDTHQVLLVSIPRDYYIYNPALGGKDKLTHLGNNGVTNTMRGLNDFFDAQLTEYGITNFTTFQQIIDIFNGIDIDNPYEFTTPMLGGYTFAEGNIHLSGAQALAYVRERKNLPNGDFGRNEHQIIVLQAMIDKLTSREVLLNYSKILEVLQGKILTSMTEDQITGYIQQLVNSDYPTMEVISYHLAGIGDYAGTASMGWDRKLYVAWPVESQVDFVGQEMTRMMQGEHISQGTLPQ